MIRGSRFASLQKPIKDKVVTFGKNEGMRWGEVDREYIEFLLASKKEEVDALEDELRRRDLIEEAELPMAEQIIRAGYHVLAQKHHPDKGGDEVKMRELNASHEGLKELLSMQQAVP
jgi:hypothetical protein